MKCLIKMNVQVKHKVFWKLRVPSPLLGVNEDRGGWFLESESWRFWLKHDWRWRERRRWCWRGRWTDCWCHWLRSCLWWWLCAAFFPDRMEITVIIISFLIMAAGNEKSQWSAKKGFCTESNIWSRQLASKSFVIWCLISLILAVSSFLSWWLKSCDRVIIQYSQEVTILTCSISSAVMMWSIVGMWRPGVTAIDWPDLIIKGERVPALGQT